MYIHIDIFLKMKSYDFQQHCQLFFRSLCKTQGFRTIQNEAGYIGFCAKLLNKDTLKCNVTDSLVSSVMNMRRRLLDKERRELQQQNADGVGCSEWVVGVNDPVDKHTDDIVGVILIWGRRAADENFAFGFLKAVGETGNQDVLQNLFG